MNTTTHLAQLLTMPDPEFDRYLEAVNQLVSIRRIAAPASSSMPSPAVPSVPLATMPAVTSIAPKRLATRPPMRAAKAGTLRGDIHDVLRSSGKPLRRIAIIKAVADRRGRPVDEVFRGKVGDVLTNPHDPFLRRVATGTYAYVNAEEARP
jgi:hypothetical protein